MDDRFTSVIIVILLMVVFGIGGVVGRVNGRREVKMAAIELGHAQYHPTTGNFMWKTNCFGLEKE